jgi:hypothetical protein
MAKIVVGDEQRHVGAERLAAARRPRVPSEVLNLIRSRHGSDGAFLTLMLLLTFVLIACWAISMQPPR